MVIVRVEIEFFPCQMTLDDRPHLPHICSVSIILEMPHQFIDVIEIHIVMVHLVITVGITADITSGIHLCAPFLQRTGAVAFRILLCSRHRDRHIRHLRFGISIEMLHRTVIPSQHISEITSTPSCQRHSPSYRSMKPCLSVPDAIRRKDEGRTESVEIRIGSDKLHSGRELTVI